jgi:hypothetical protein
MNTPNNLKQLQQHVYWSYHQDGLLDILIGLGVIGFGIMLLTGEFIYNLLGWSFLILYIPLKKAITFPRFGFIQMQTRRTLSWMLVSLAMGVVFLVLVLGLVVQIRNDLLPAGLRALLITYDMLLIGVLLSIPLIIVSALTGLRRMLVYVGLVLIVILGGILLGIEPPFYMIALGASILIVGAVYLGRFLARYPVRKSDSQNGE